MPLLRITVDESGPRLGCGRRDVSTALRAALAQSAGPPVVMAHGYKYQPDHPLHCPHNSIFSPQAKNCGPKLKSWPRQMGLLDPASKTLGIAFAWPARGTLREAHARAETAGQMLAEVLRDIRRLAPRRPATLIAHSLGARVCLTAIRQSRPGTVHRAVLLAAAEYTHDAARALTSEGGRSVQVLNVTSRENDLYDFLLERLVPAPAPADRMLGHGGLDLPGLVTLQLDDPQSLDALKRAGFPVAPPQRLICHWSPYTRGGVFPLYAAYLAGRLPHAHLRAALPDAPAPRWSRLMPRLPRLYPQGLPAE